MLVNSTVHDIFTTKSAQGLLTAADSLPSVVIIRNGTDTTVITTVLAGALAGEYKYSFDVPANWLVGDEVHARITAVVNGVAVYLVRRLGEVGEVDKLDELYKLNGLDNSTPLFVPAGAGTITAGADIEIDVAGDCNTGHTFSRNVSP